VDLLTAVIGAVSIYLGYGLFCDSAYQKKRIRHLAAGALLAVFGLGILIADVRSIRAERSGSPSARQKTRSTKEGSFETPKVNKRIRVAERMV